MDLDKVLNYFISSLSGERAKRITAKLSQYHRIQASKEFHSALEYFQDELKKLGDKNNVIHEYIADGTKRYYGWNTPISWDIRDGELIQIEPSKKILCQYSETPESICTHSKSVETEAEIVHIREAKPDEIKDMNLSGKIVLTSGSPRSIFEQLHEHGVLGIIAYPSEQRSQGYLDMIQYVGLWPNAENLEKSTFGFSISRKQALELIQILEKGEKIIVKAKIDADLYEGKMHVLSTKIEGSQKSEEEIILISHICHPAPSANDNASGSALLLEIYRALKTLIDQKKIQKPHRTIRFLWVPEFHGTIPWIQEQLSNEEFNPLICINLDMCGEHPALVGYPFTVNISSISTPTYLNDLIVKIINKVKDNKSATEQGGWQFPWNYRIEKYSGGSDHIIFNDEPTRIPSVMFGHKDTFHHTNLDTIEKVDSTTLKRVGITAAVVTSMIAYTDIFSTDVLKSYNQGYQIRKAKLLNIIIDEISSIERIEDDELTIYQGILRKIIDIFTEYEKLALNRINYDFKFTDNTITNFLRTDLDSFIEKIETVLQENNIKAQIEDQQQKYLLVPKRKWEGPVNLRFLADFRREFDEEKIKLEKEQFQRIKEFIDRSMTSYGGNILEITNSINGKNTILDILAFQSHVEGKIPQIQTTLDFLEYLKNHELIDFG
jgi:hypothetical protein